MNKPYKLNEEIEFGYQAPNAVSGLEDAVAEIYLPDKVKDSSFPDVVLEEVGDTGTYRGAFTPDSLGVWQVIMHLAGGDGQVNKAYSVGNYNIHDIGAAVDTLQAALTALGDVATDGDITAAQGVITDAIGALNNIDAAGVQAAAAAAISAASLATAINVSDAQSAIAALIDALPTDADVQAATTAAISAAGLATASAVASVKTVVDGIADSVASLDTPPQAF